MSKQKQKVVHGETRAQNPPSEAKFEKQVDDDLLNFDDLKGAKEKLVQKWRQVGQTGGE